ncbi:hypothetical protein Axy09_028 [Achromobacter phage vB_AxyP_19-32_Axy09]|uniref:DNMP kinase n=1 Tax=Achromobacter phage vB_AxyP_19-32_Axy09 TaxID=2591040 RepID=A0A514CTS2_9CAUD|nr:hypothetical protein Axy09_028 [Achromobacter phage vB_AxyP_19-32_Axy09]
MRKIICIAGLARAGKDTFASELVYALRGLDADVQLIRFADPLKAASARLWGNVPDDTKEDKRMIMYEELIEVAKQTADMLHVPQHSDFWYTLGRTFEQDYVPSVHGYLISPRRLEQLLGTQIMRRFYPGCFVDRVVRVSGDAEFTVVPDCRFENEQLIADHLAFVYRESVNGAEVPEHGSEALNRTIDLELRAYTSLPEYHVRIPRALHVFDNSGTIDELKTKAAAWALSLAMDTVVGDAPETKENEDV